MNFACNYAVARFLPYVETEEFVNIGVLLHCSETGYLDFRLARKWSRVTAFFPELDKEVFRNASQLFRVDLTNARMTAGSDHPQQLVMAATPGEDEKVFRETVRTRESLFRFGTPRTVLTANPEAKLEDLYSFYVDRQFAREREYQETMMTNHLRKMFFRSGSGFFFRSEAIGNENYSVNVPFVFRKGNLALKAIKPLDLNKETSTKIYEHGDQWIKRVQRLRAIDCLPRQFLFAVRSPAEGQTNRIEAAREIERELELLDTTIVPFRADAQLLEFARVA